MSGAPDASPATTPPASHPLPTAQSSDRPPPTGLVLYNGNLLTMDPALPNAEAILVRGDTIAAVGTTADVQAAAGTGTLAIDLAGRTVLPGFIDSHSHRLTQRHKWGFDTFEQAVEHALTEGWTGIDELAVHPDELDSLLAADAGGELRLRVNAYLTANSFSGEPLGDWFAAYRPGQEISPYLRIAGLKIFIDFDSGRTLLWEQDELDEYVRQRRAEGWQVSMKAIGQQSHELALNAIEQALDGAPNDRDRYRLEHSLGVSDGQLERMARLGIIAAIQPSFPGVVWYEEDIRNLTDEEGRHNMFRWPEYLAAGVIATASPYNPDPRYPELVESSHVSPLGLLYRTVTQVGLDGSEPASWMLDRALSVDQMLPLMTTAGAYATATDDVRGSLTIGKLADLVVLSDNPRSVPATDLLDVDVLLTMVGGRIEWCASRAADLCTAGEPPPPTPSTGDSSLSASAWLPEHPPADAHDGSLETIWNAGDHPQQWIQVDLGQARPIGRISLTVSQYPEGETVHEVWGGPDENDLRLLHTFAGHTTDLQVLTVGPVQAWPHTRVVRIVTTSSPSWVAWYEIEIEHE